METREGPSPAARAYLRSARFRDALRQCEEACRAVGITSLALAISHAADGDKHQLRECWRTSMATADVLRGFDEHEPTTTRAIVLACERVARWTTNIALHKPLGSEWTRCAVLADECAHRCVVLAQQLEPEASHASSPVR